MVNENDKTTTQVAQKEEWKEPEIVELDINKTESGALLDLVEVFLVSHNS
ncbi:hypothetical protein BN3087_830002 [Sulfurovum sp. enrichment culture clone C5]|uniref:Uncharacterized protein n=1 Tax=Sulfurovum sp. enrichment culture clone C5 TaxID=497650 RepID=A0A0S4XQS2_9BACT|nr:hypothetical protein BN3087_830002 [Sulfurovum sp. enrichment culture clone C5]